MSWRLGHKIEINVYDGDRPVCQCHTRQDAVRIVGDVNARPELADLVAKYRHALLSISQLRQVTFNQSPELHMALEIARKALAE